MLERNCVCLSVLLSVVSCGGESQDQQNQESSLSAALAPSGSDATYLGSTMKPSWYPGERGVVSVTMQNAGANDWSPTTPTFALSSLDGQWGWTYTPVSTTVHPSGTNVFSFLVGAPNAAGSQTFTADMQALGRGGFGGIVAIPVTVSLGSARQWGCTYLPGSSTLPTTLAPNENRYVTVTVQNTGTDTWTSGFYLASHDTPTNLWGQTNVLLGASLGTGGTKTWGFAIHAPATTGSYRLTREMLSPSPTGIGFFQASNFCVDVPITVSGTPASGATVASQNFPSVMAPGETATVTVGMTNAGTDTWQNDGSYVLSSESSPVNLWGITTTPVRTTTAMGATALLYFNVTAPPTPGTYSQKWQMRKLSGSNAGFIGSILNVPVVVSGSATPGYGATVSSESTLPTTAPGTWYGVTVGMKNTGSQTWQGSTFGLHSMSTPVNAWQTTFIALGASDSVPPGAVHTFSFYVKAPATTGNDSTAWRMIQTNGVGLFGETATNGGTQAGGTRDCLDLLRGNPTLPNGVYTIDIDGAGPTAPFDVFCDMTNGGWTQVNDQDVSVDGGFLPISTWLAGVNTTAPNGGQWGVLNHLSALSRITGDYELRLTYGQDESRSATWVQTGDPLSGSRGTLSSVNMTPANQIGCGTFDGLGADGGPAALDGNSNGCWWFAVGSSGSFGGGIPAYEGSTSGQFVADRVRLYVRR